MLSRFDPYRLPGWLSLALAPFGWLYGLAAVRSARVRRRRARRLDRPVISVGNLTVGGTGKTPVCGWLAAALRDAGLRPAILTRGYGAAPLPAPGGILLVSDGKRLFVDADRAGDEPCLLAKSLPGVAVVRGADRYAAGRWFETRYDVDVFLLDDGFQHIQLHRDFNLLLVDARRGLGRGRVLPAGPLREPLRAVDRADALLLTRTGGIAPRDRLPRRLRGRIGDKPVWGVDFVPTGLSGPDGRRADLPWPPRGLSAVAAAGLAEPEQFFQMTEKLGVNLLARFAFPDHHPYAQNDADQLAAAVAEKGARCLLTTGKDSVKLGRLALPVPLYTVEITLDPAPVGLLDALAAHPAFRDLLGPGLGRTK